MATAGETMTMILTAEDRASSVLGKVGGSLTSLTGLFTGLVSASGLLAFGKQVIDLAGHLQDLSEQTGISAQTLSGIQSVLEESGTSVDAFAKGIFTAQKNIGQGSNEVKKAIQDLGLDFNQLRAASPERFLELVAGALGSIEDPITRNTLGAQLLGRAFKELSPALAQVAGQLDELRAKGMSEANIKSLEQFGDAVGRITLGLKIATAAPLAGLTDFVSNLFTTMEDVQKRIKENVAKIHRDLEKSVKPQGITSDAELEGWIKEAGVIKKTKEVIEAMIQARAQERLIAAQRAGDTSTISAMESEIKASEKRLEIFDKELLKTQQLAAAKLNALLIVDPKNIMGDIVRQINEAFKSGLPPTPQQAQLMTAALAEIQTKTFRTFGIDVPAHVQSAIDKVDSLIQKMLTAAGIKVEGKVGGALSGMGGALSGMGGTFPGVAGQGGTIDMGGGSLSALVESVRRMGHETGEIETDMGGWRKEIGLVNGVFTNMLGPAEEARTIVRGIQTDTEGWGKEIELVDGVWTNMLGPADETRTIVRGIKDDSKGLFGDAITNAVILRGEVTMIKALIEAINAQGGIKVSGGGQSLETQLQREKLTTNGPEY